MNRLEFQFPNSNLTINPIIRILYNVVTKPTAREPVIHNDKKSSFIKAHFFKLSWVMDKNKRYIQNRNTYQKKSKYIFIRRCEEMKKLFQYELIVYITNHIIQHNQKIHHPVHDLM